MAQANVNVGFETEGPEEAKQLVEGWKLHPGCNVFISVTDQSAPYQTDAKGKAAPVPEPEPPEPAPELEEATDGDA